MLFARKLAPSLDNKSAVSQPPKVRRSLSPSYQKIMTPSIGLAQPWLFTAGKDSPALLHELQSKAGECVLASL